MIHYYVNYANRLSIFFEYSLMYLISRGVLMIFTSPARPITNLPNPAMLVTIVSRMNLPSSTAVLAEVLHGRFICALGSARI